MTKNRFLNTLLIVFIFIFLTGCNLFNKNNESFNDHKNADESMQSDHSELNNTDNKDNFNEDESIKEPGSEDSKDNNIAEKSEEKISDERKEAIKAETKAEEKMNNNYIDIPSNFNLSTSVNTGMTENEALKKYWLQIDDVAKSAQYYYTEYFAKTRLISKDGLFYNMAAREQINVKYLIDNGSLSSKNIIATCSVLLIYGSDLEKFQGVDVSEADKGLTVFVSIKNPIGSGYLIGSQNSKGGILSAKDYINLLGSYSQNHGSIRALYPNTDNYKKIINFISIYESKFDQYFVRSIVSDDKYALVTFSPQSNTSEVHQYILVNENGFWEVVMTGVESEPRLLIAINKKIPDFNFEMLPKYSIYEYKNKIRSDFNSIYSVLISNGYISSEDDLKYISGTDAFTYVVTNNEKKFLLILKNGSWELSEVSSGNDAIKMMENIISSAPTFIVWDR